MRKFRCRLPYDGSPAFEVEAKDVDGAMDAAARIFGWESYAEMRENHVKHGAWKEDGEGGFRVELVRENDNATAKS